MADDFAKAVDDGLKLAKRIYFGKDRAAVTPPKHTTSMERLSPVQSYLPPAPMVYAVIPDPGIVDNPDIPSYQPHVHGRCNPPALIPLQMNGIELEVECCLDTALVRVTGSWRVHCVMGSRSCDCRLAIPMGEQGSVLSVEVEVPRKSYSTQLISVEDGARMEKSVRPENGGFLRPNIFTLTIPQIDGGTNLSIKMYWSQKLLYSNGHFTVRVPFKFPEYVTPAVKKISKKEKIQLSVNAGTGTEVLCKSSSHPLKELKRQAGKLGFCYEAEVLKWSSIDFNFSYTVSPDDIFGGLFLQSPSANDLDQREFCSVYLVPGKQENMKLFRRSVIFVVDISASMLGKPLEDTKNAISTALSKLNADDSFNVIAFNDDNQLFSTSMDLATKEAIESAIQWIEKTFVADGGTNMLPPLDKAIEMLSNTQDLIPMIFFVTDGSVGDERHICNVIKSRLASSGSICPRMYTFGIGSYCNHYFLKTLATISRGHYDAACDVDFVQQRMERLFTKGLSTVFANINIVSDDNLDGFEVYPTSVPDLSSESPLTVSGRFKGKLPENLKAVGLLGDLGIFAVNLRIESAKDMPLEKIIATQQVSLLTAQAWLSQNEQLEEKIAKMSIQTCVPSEYNRMILLENVVKAPEQGRKKKTQKKDETQKMESRAIPLKPICLGFGDTVATAENIQPGDDGEPKPADAAEMLVKAASNCCSAACNKCCCMCCIQCCSKLNDQCVLIFTQLFTALACLGCFECCSQLCCAGDEG